MVGITIKLCCSARALAKYTGIRSKGRRKGVFLGNPKELVSSKSLKVDSIVKIAIYTYCQKLVIWKLKMPKNVRQSQK